VEKHFTLDRALPGGDNFLSLTPPEVKKLLQKMTNLSEITYEYAQKSPYFGVPEKTPQPGERPELMRRAAVAARFLPKGTHLAEKDLLFQRALPQASQGELLRPDATYLGCSLIRGIGRGELVYQKDLHS
ncbi:MAG: N-acetylneuraminate synthase family protein, partial [Deltaproteobacteria bacterium]|jgi:sialic acid synthase SpsE|nr:N-acetylneuraminate synthase family protein [Deltaproteobacteria bacterium]